MSNSSKPGHRRTVIGRVLFLDLLADPKARQIFIYVAAFITLSATIFHWLEGWSWLDSFYFVVITFTTIGYGDIVPTMPITKLISIFVALNGVAILLMLFDEMRRVRSWHRAEEPLQGSEVNQG
jgi:hypothetical protein